MSEADPGASPRLAGAAAVASSRGVGGEVAADDRFFSLTPERVLEAVERSGFETHPVCYPLNSFENRVYEVELADRSRIVAKFYRPHRWSEAQILEEHALLDELVAEEVPVAGVLRFPDGRSIARIENIVYSLWQRRGGRAPDELSDAALERLGMFVGRMHAVGRRREFTHRPALDVARYVEEPIDVLRNHPTVSEAWRRRFLDAARAVGELAGAQLEGAACQRIHADLHLGNVLFRDGELRVLDFDDACTGPPVQDIWLATPGRGSETERRRAVFLEGYERFCEFDHASLDLVESLRALRMVRYVGWIARRWNDPAFRQGWPQFATEDYWRTETIDLEEQVAVLRRERQAPRRASVSSAAAVPGSSVATGDPAEDPSELTNKDYFWDWEDG